MTVPAGTAPASLSEHDLKQYVADGSWTAGFKLADHGGSVPKLTGMPGPLRPASDTSIRPRSRRAPSARAMWWPTWNRQCPPPT